MARCKPPKALKIRVPRQNAQRIGPSLTAEVHVVARQDGVIVHLPPPVQEQPSSAGPSSENASEWNSLLLSARAQRGPFWDVGTQQFLVEKESELYYDPTLLLEAARSLSNANSQQNAEGTSNSGTQGTIALQQQPQRSIYPNQQYAYGNNVGTPGTPQRNMPGYPGTPGSAQAMPGGQYFGESVTPTRPGMMDGVGHSPEIYGRRITRGMSDGYQNYGS